MQPTDSLSIQEILKVPILMELVRNVVGGGYVLCLGLVVAFAIRRFAGPRGRAVARWHLPFAVGSLLLLVVLGIARGPIEYALSILVEPLNRLTAQAAPNWPHDVTIGIFRTFLATLLLVLAIQLIGRLYWRWENQLQSKRNDPNPSFVHWVVVGTTFLRILRVASIFFVVFSFVPYYLSQFPRSRQLVDQAAQFFGSPAHTILMAIVAYLPDLGYLIVILLLGRYCLRAIRYLFDSLDKGTLQIRGFHPEWALPSYRLSRTLFLFFLLMVCYPYLTGSKSQFFQGFSVFVGALLTLGSSGAIGNVVAGTLLTYTRAFRLGDMVKIGEFTGVITEKSLLVTRVRSSRNEEISIPNGNVLSGSVLNYSARAAAGGVILTVEAGIGYDVDWRTVHALMLEGARATEHIIQDPPPKVWQAALGDYAVNYELRAATANTNDMWETYSTLRRNVLDAFNRAGVEIMTPSIFAHRDASGLAVPNEQFPNKPAASGIAVDVRQTP
ncbi:MAG: mechanosensitive ion channel [Acidobacteria bacterium]|nr:mechanosensitive ion channel [Acidobacteriota bacterium]